MSIIIFRGWAVGASSLDDVEARKAYTDAVDQLLVEGACWWLGKRCRLRRVVGKGTGAIEEDVSWNALTGE